MATKVLMEALSPTMEEGRITNWLKKEGDAVTVGDVLAEVETDKAVMELQARGDGVLRTILIGEGTTTDVGNLVAVIAGEDEDISELLGGGRPMGMEGGQARQEIRAPQLSSQESPAPSAPPPSPKRRAPAFPPGLDLSEIGTPSRPGPRPD